MRRKTQRFRKVLLFYCFALNEKGREFINPSMGLPGIIITGKGAVGGMEKEKETAENLN